ncbi:DUF4926 domain-containing protein [Gloeobacter kilaueensis]|uniref:DUF4926 domain-containing protein n=1 Tax=Gloeobacter kilaueensis (strain ATCC BAA-2537 / CCAP 1431/1 / ULC 316 / JS1) TaxID=1183438 RepID=U5QQY6_GLOK1|nr:DUF4926 domain-containing protein [Gloeobacter kilaueensis]AGY60064.1 hypothetical protein GKIL_3818 [Gloeobacter kilaueensis JS1]
MDTDINLHDVVELLVDLNEPHLRQGSTGTVVDRWASGEYEVEFSDETGRALAMVALTPAQFRVVWKLPSGGKIRT